MGHVFQTVVLSLLALSLSAPAYAANCPVANPAYFELLTKLDGFLKTIKKGPECQSLVDELTQLQVVYSKSDRDLVEKAVHPGKIETLEASDLEKLAKYSEAVTAKLGSVVAAIGHSDRCFGSKTLSPLVSLSAIAQETAKIGSSLNGSTGVALGVSAAAISGILLGLDSVAAKFRDPYNFNNSDDRVFFMTNLCAYNEIREDTLRLLSPETQLSLYQQILQELIRKKELLTRKSPEGAALSRIESIQSSIGPKLQDLTTQLNALRATMGSPWERCSKISQMVRSRRNSHLDALVEILKDPDLAPLTGAFGISPAEVVSLLRAADGAPSSSECYAKTDQQQLIERNQRSIDLLEEFVATFKLILESVAQDNRALAKAKALQIGIDVAAELDLVKVQILQATQQIAALNTLQGPGSFGARRELMERREYLDQRFFTQLGPRLIAWYAQDLEKSWDSYETEERKEIKALSRQYLGKKRFEKAPGTWQEFLDLARTQPKAMVHAAMASRIEIVMSNIANAAFSLVALSNYCDYFAKSGVIDSKAVRTCTDTLNGPRAKRFTDIGPVFKALGEYGKWCYENGFLDRDRVESILDQLHKTNEKLDSGTPRT